MLELTDDNKNLLALAVEQALKISNDFFGSSPNQAPLIGALVPSILEAHFVNKTRRLAAEAEAKYREVGEAKNALGMTQVPMMHSGRW